ncbi:MAG TPA: hypothetical protein PLA69_00160 [Flavobacterium sp.]|nr:hypothetical protein [Flavobacterium sp.]
MKTNRIPSHIPVRSRQKITGEITTWMACVSVGLFSSVLQDNEELQIKYANIRV